MSETDDTDVLLLIPPNFFLVQSSESEDSLLDSSRTVVHKPVSCTAQVLGKLVDQVHCLESRLESLEFTSDTVSSVGSLPRRRVWNTTSESLSNLSWDRRCSTFPRRRRRKTTKKGKRRELSLTSLDSCSTLKQIPHLNLEENCIKKNNINDTLSMDGDISSIVSTPNKKTDKLLLHEIDEFLTKVEAYESPDTKFKEQETTLSPENVIKATRDYIAHNLDPKSNDEVKLPSGRIVTSDILDKYIYLVKSNSGSTTSNPDRPLPSSFQKYQYNDESDRPTVPKDTPKVETKSPSIRRLNFSDTKDVQPTSTPKRQPQSTYLDTFRPSSNKIYDRASKVLEQYKSNQSRATDSYLSPKKEEFKMPQMRPYVSEHKESLKLAAYQNKLIETIDTDLLSLSELWGEKGDRTERGENLKLEEERLKREHCEAMIQQLQKKILEQQEKLAVALKVDRAKDAAITKLREAWLKITNSLDKVEERHQTALEKMVREVDNFKTVAGEAQKKTNHFETELYKALDLAHDYQEKCKQLSKDIKDLQEKMESAAGNQKEIAESKEKEISVLKENYETVMRLNKQSTDCVRNLEEALVKEKSDHESTKSRVAELSHRLQSYHEETSLTVQERDVLKGKINEERGRCNMLEKQLNEKNSLSDNLLTKCETLENEVKSLNKLLELQKNELKLHYQKQLEDAVLAKLKEFQLQLDRAERDMETDSRSKQNQIVDTYNKQMVRVEEQHKLEVNVLEEKQREEIKLYRLQLAQASEKIGLLESKLESYRRRRGDMASQLHAVMQAQWRQALLILTHGHGTNVGLDLTRPDSVSTVLPTDYAPPQLSANPLAARGGPDRRPDRFSFEGLSDNELQQYVKLLLTKPPTMDGSGDALRASLEEPTSDRHDDKHRDKTKRHSNSNKPPWKS